MTVNIREITFEEILVVWDTHLWPGRQSSIERSSAIVYSTQPFRYDTSYADSVKIFFGLYDNNKLAGVNSGHATGNNFRSRGLYVFDEFRGKGYGTMLLLHTIEYAKSHSFESVWSIPRQSSFKSYQHAGFIQTSDWFATETSEKNAYAHIILSNDK